MVMQVKPLNLGRIASFDERSRDYPVRELFAPAPPKTTYWDCPVQLDQGHTSACTGFSWAACLASMPESSTGVTNQTGLDLYNTAKTLDDWPGENYNGSSVLAGAKAVAQKYPGALDSYRWAFSFDEMLQTLSYVAPCVLGINWYASMFTPNAQGVIDINGNITGGHAILATGLDVDQYLIRLHNSWGNWNGDGNCYISFNSMKRLLSENGECCALVGKKSITL